MIDPRTLDNSLPFTVEDPAWLRALEEREERSKYSLPIPYFSWNQAFTVLMCPACYEGIYIEKRPHPKHISLFRGGLIAHGLGHGRTILRELARRGAGPNDRPFEGMGGRRLMGEVLEAGGEHFDAEIRGERVDEFDEPLPPEPPDINWGSLHKTGTYKNGRAKPTSLVVRRRLLGQVKDTGLQMLRAAVARQLLREPWTAYEAVEAFVDFEGIFPFDFVGYLDVAYRVRRLGGRRGEVLAINDDKTTAKPPHKPEWWTACQVTAYGMPWQRSGQPWVGQVVQVAESGTKKAGTAGIPQVNVYRLVPTNDQVEAVRRQILSAAGVVSSGHFPPTPSWLCKFDHGLPGFSEVEPTSPFRTDLEQAKVAGFQRVDPEDPLR